MLTEIAISSDYGERIHTPTVVDVVLPLPELMPREVATPEDVNFRGGGVVTLGARTILWRATNRELTLELANLNGSRTGSHVLSFVAPGPILSYCTVLSGSGGNFVVDFFIKSGFLYTIELPFTCFDNWAPPPLWRTVKCPFGVDCVTPMSLRSRGPLELVVALADGTVARLGRPTALAELEIATLVDHTEPGLLSRVMGRSDEVAGVPGLSVRAAADVCSFNDHIVSLSVGGSLRVWSTAHNTLVREVPGQFSTTTPSSYLRVAGEHLFAYSRHEFVVYDTKFEVVGSFEIPEQLHSWYMVDFTVTAGSVIAAFRAFQSSQVWSFGPDGSYPISAQKPEISRVPDAREMHRFIDNIFSVKTYSSSTLRKSLAVYANTSETDVANLTISAPASTALSLRDAVTAAIHKHSSLEKTDARLQWIRFDSICQEFESQLNEVQAVGLSADGLIWSVRAAYYTLLVQDHSSTSNGPLVDAIQSLWNATPPASLSAFEDDIKKSLVGFASWGSDLVAATATSLYESHISPYIDERSILEIRARLVDIQNLDAQLAQILDKALVKDATVDGADDTLTPLGCAALSTVALDHAESSLKFVSKVIFFTLFASGEGLTRSHTEAFVRGISHIRTALAIISLREPLESHLGPFNAQTTALEISVSQLNLQVHDFTTLVPRLWQKLDFTDVENLFLIVNLIKQHWNSTALLNSTQYLLDDAESQFVRGLAKLSIPEQQETGENIIRAFSFQLSKETQPHGRNLKIDGFGQGIAQFYFTLAKLCREISIPGSCSLGFAKLACRMGPNSIEMSSLYLELALGENNYLQAYEAICRLSKQGDPLIKDHLEKFLDATINQRTMEYVCKELVFPGLVDLVPEILAERTTIGGLPTYKLLYMWSISRRNYLGAAKAIYNYIHGAGKDDGNFLDLYTITLNAIKLVAEEGRWFVVNKRIVTEADIQQEYQNIYLKD